MANTRVLKQLLASNNVRSEAQRRRSRGFRNWFRMHGLRALSDDQDNSWPLSTQLKARNSCLTNALLEVLPAAVLPAHQGASDETLSALVPWQSLRCGSSTVSPLVHAAGRVPHVVF